MFAKHRELLFYRMRPENEADAADRANRAKVFRAYSRWIAVTSLESNPRALRRKTRVVLALGVFSLATTASGTLALVKFNWTPGRDEPTRVGNRWPALSNIQRSKGRGELLVFVHPLCTCTRATIAELSNTLRGAMAGEKPEITFLVYRPNLSAGWSRKETERQASSIPGVRFIWDDGGVEAHKLGAQVSGLVLLYDTAGSLRFRGGVTESRGHEGPNAGILLLQQALNKSEVAAESRTDRTRVYGCSLTGSSL